MVGKNINVNQAKCVVLLKLRVVKSAVIKVLNVKLLWGLKFSRLEYYKIAIRMVWASYMTAFTTVDFLTLSFNNTTHLTWFALMFFTYHLCTIYSYYSAL
jgi:hypothetical protein